MSMPIVTGVTATDHTRTDGSVWTEQAAERVLIAGVPHGAGDRVLMPSMYGGWEPATIHSIVRFSERVPWSVYLMAGVSMTRRRASALRPMPACPSTGAVMDAVRRGEGA